MRRVSERKILTRVVIKGGSRDLSREYVAFTLGTCLDSES